MAGVIHRESKGLHGKFGSLQTSQTAENACQSRAIKVSSRTLLKFGNFISNLFITFFFWFRSANGRQKALKAHKTTIVSSAYTALVSAIKIIQVSFCRDKLKVFLFFQITFPSKR